MEFATVVSVEENDSVRISIKGTIPLTALQRDSTRGLLFDFDVVSAALELEKKMNGDVSLDKEHDANTKTSLEQIWIRTIFTRKDSFLPACFTM